jgi:hypothetical protein
LARDVPAWIGLVPKQNSTGGKGRLGSISKGRQPLLSVIRRAKQVGYTRRAWLAELMARRPIKVAAIALANTLKGKDDLVSQVSAKYDMKPDQAQREVDVVLKGRKIGASA